jgi:hypothetical protein
MIDIAHPVRSYARRMMTGVIAVFYDWREICAIFKIKRRALFTASSLLNKKSPPYASMMSFSRKKK